MTITPMAVTYRVLACASIALAIVALTGCASDIEILGVDGHDLRIVMHDPLEDATTSTDVTGRTVAVGSCIGLQIDDEVVLAVFPEPSFIVENKSVRIGDLDPHDIVFGVPTAFTGAYLDPAVLSGFEDIPADCVTTRLFFVEGIVSSD